MLIEVAVASADDALIAHHNGADRIELCCALDVAGLTPTPGLLAEVRRLTNLPVVALLRPRPGHFIYGDPDQRVIEHDLDLLLDHHVGGIALGALNSDGSIDLPLVTRLRQRIPASTHAVFHRAFDATPNPFTALDQLIDLGFTRVLTSGQAASALDGIDLLRRLIDHAAGRIEILPAAGINVDNARQIAQITGCAQLHASLRTPALRPPDAFDAPPRRTDAHSLRALRALFPRPPAESPTVALSSLSPLPSPSPADQSSPSA